MVKIDGFSKYKFLSSLKVSDTNEFATVISHVADLESDCYKSKFYILNLDKKTRKHIDTDFDITAEEWLDKDTLLLKTSFRDGKTHFLNFNVQNNEICESFVLSKNVKAFKILDLNKIVLLIGDDVSDPKDFKQNDKYEIIDEIPFWDNNSGFISKKRTRLYIYDKNSKELKLISPDMMNVSFFEITAKGIIFTGLNYKDKMTSEQGLYIYEPGLDTTRTLLENKFLKIQYATMLEDKFIIVANSGKRYGFNENPCFYTLEDKNLKLIADPDISTGNTVMSDCMYKNGFTFKTEGEYLYFIATESRNSLIKRIDKHGNISDMTLPKGSVESFDVRNKKIYFIGLRDYALEEVYLAENDSEIELTDFNSNFYSENEIAHITRMTYKVDGYDVDGYVLLPPDFDEISTYPAILTIHGGPKDIYNDVFYHEMQYWANSGYVVMYCNPVGSDGKGNKFADTRGKYGVDDYNQFMGFTDYVMEKIPQIDKKRLCLIGYSYGGYMVNTIITRSDKFCAAVSDSGISDWITKFIMSQSGFYYIEDQFGATPWSNFEKLWNDSPLKNADNVKTPTLFIVGTSDYRVTMGQGIGMFTALKYHDVPARLLMIRGEDHNLYNTGTPSARLRRIEEITRWFAKYTN